MTMNTVNTINTFISYHLVWTIWLQTPNLYYTLYVCILQLSDEILISPENWKSQLACHFSYSCRYTWWLRGRNLWLQGVESLAALGTTCHDVIYISFGLANSCCFCCIYLWFTSMLLVDCLFCMLVAWPLPPSGLGLELGLASYGIMLHWAQVNSCNWD